MPLPLICRIGRTGKEFGIMVLSCHVILGFAFSVRRNDERLQPQFR